MFHLPQGRRRIPAAWRCGVSATGACGWTAQEDDVVWRRGGVDGGETWHGRCNSTALKMDWWQVAAAASYPAGVLVEECDGLVGAPYPAGVLVGTLGLRC